MKQILVMMAVAVLCNGCQLTDSYEEDGRPMNWGLFKAKAKTCLGERRVDVRKLLGEPDSVYGERRDHYFFGSIFGKKGSVDIFYERPDGDLWYRATFITIDGGELPGYEPWEGKWDGKPINPRRGTP